MTKKVMCKCVHEFQDKTYGKQVRIANPTTKIFRAEKPPTMDVRCTVCNTIHRVRY